MKVNCEYTEMSDVDLLTHHPMNPNKHSDRQIELLAKIMNHQGWRAPIVVSNRSGFIVSGHGRLMAAQKLGWKTVPISRQDFKDEAQEFSHLIADNKIASIADHDDSLMIDGIKTLGITDLELLGMDGFELPTDPTEAQCDEDEVPEHVEPRTKLGDIYTLGKHRLMCGDSTSVDAVEQLMDGEKADMVFTDPPYGISEAGDRRKRNAKNSLREGVQYKDFIDDSIQYAVDAFNLCAGLQIPIQVWFGANYYCHAIPQSNNWLVWDKRVEENQTNFNSDCELAWVQNDKNSIRIFRHLWKGLIKGSEHSQARVHPTQKPIALAEWCFERYGLNSKSVLDLFGGSGSTLIACEKTNRKCFVMELDPHYVDIIIARWQKYTGKKAELIG